MLVTGRYQWLRGLRRRSAATHLLRSWVWIPPGARMFVCCEFCVLWVRGLCDELITRPEESYQLWCIACDLETSRMRSPWPALGHNATKKKKREPNSSTSSHPNSSELLVLKWKIMKVWRHEHQGCTVLLDVQITLQDFESIKWD